MSSRFHYDWSQKDKRLVEMHREGLSRNAIAERLGVSSGAVKARLQKLGLIK